MMIALGSLTGFEDAEALIKSKVGEFLLAETKLRTLKTNPSVTIQSKASGLLEQHKQIEQDLSSAKAAAERIQSKAFVLDDGYLIGRVSLELMSHLRSVEALEKEAGTFIADKMNEPYALTGYILGGVAAIGILFGLFSRK